MKIILLVYCRCYSLRKWQFCWGTVTRARVSGEAGPLAASPLVVLARIRDLHSEHEHGFRISIQLRSQSPHSSLLLTSCKGDYRYEIGVKCCIQCISTRFKKLYSYSDMMVSINKIARLRRLSWLLFWTCKCTLSFVFLFFLVLF